MFVEKTSSEYAPEGILIKGRVEIKSRFNTAVYLKPYMMIIVGVIILTAALKVLQLGFHPIFDLTNIALLYLLPVLYSAVRWSRTPSIFCAILSIVAFDVFFVPPVLSLTVADLRYLVIFGVFLVVALITGDLASRLKNQAESARKREERTAALYALSRQMAAETDLHNLLVTIVNVVGQSVDGDAVIYIPHTAGSFAAPTTTVTTNKPLDNNEQVVADWVFANGQFAGRGSGILNGSKGLYIPLRTQEKVLGVLGVLPSSPDQILPSEQHQLLEAFSSLAAVAILRLQLAVEAQQARHVAESEKLRTALFNSVSHDLRTPLASITGAVTSLQEEGVYDVKARQALVDNIKEGAQRMNHMVGNLLDTARLESGMLKLNKDWCDMQDIIGVALSRVHDVLKDRPMRIEIPSELPLVQADFSLIEQVIVNLLYNAVKYSPSGSEISIAVHREDGVMQVSIGDRGLGIPEEDRDRVFDKFYRLYSPEHVSGTGLGLSICKGLVEVHGGHIWVDAAPDGGSMFKFTLPLEIQPIVKEPTKEEGANNAC